MLLIDAITCEEEAELIIVTIQGRMHKLHHDKRELIIAILASGIAVYLSLIKFHFRLKISIGTIPTYVPLSRGLVLS